MTSVGNRGRRMYASILSGVLAVLVPVVLGCAGERDYILEPDSESTDGCGNEEENEDDDESGEESDETGADSQCEMGRNKEDQSPDAPRSGRVKKPVHANQ